MSLQEKANCYQSYVLRYNQEEEGSRDKPATGQFMVHEASNEQRQQDFDSFEQVVDFLLDKLLETEGSQRATV